MKSGDWIFITIFALLTVIVGFTSQQNVRLKQEREELKNEIQELNREIGEYEAMDSFWEDYIDLLDEIYQGKINEAVLQERVKWLEQKETQIDTQQMYDDFEELIDIIIYYYEETNMLIDVETYVEINYPDLYERIMGY